MKKHCSKLEAIVFALAVIMQFVLFGYIGVFLTTK